jgi:hypothetical protein
MYLWVKYKYYPLGAENTIANDVTDSQAFKTILLIAVMLVLAGIAFMASVAAQLQAAAVATAGLIVLIVLVDAFKALGRGR